MMLAAVSALMLAVAAAAEPAAAPVLDADATAAEMVAACRAMIPRDVTVEGRIVLRNRKGIVQAEYGYALTRAAGETHLTVTDKGGAPVAFEKEGRLLGTDVTWSDLTLDYLWWDDFDREREAESVHGQMCSVVKMRRGDRAVRVWVDRRTGALMQAEEMKGEKPVRRLWGTRIRKFGERWAPNVLEVETLGSGHRTKITVEKLT